MSDTTRDLLVHGIAAAKSGGKAEAKHDLEWLLRLDASMEEKKEALFWLSQVSDDHAQKREYIEEILSNDLWDARARRELAILDGKLDEREIVDPDQLIQPSSQTVEETKASRFTCPTCGGRMTYTPDGQSLTCEYCEARQPLTHPAPSAPAIESHDFIIGLATAKGHLSMVNSHTITCRGCGAKFIMPPQQLTWTCPYCHSSYVLEQIETSETSIPNGLIPFQVTVEDAKKALRDWFATQGFQPRPHVSPGHGMYLPAWSFDVGGQICLRFDREEDQRGWVAQTDYQTIQQQAILIPATNHLSKSLSSVFNRFDLKKVTPYDERYLVDWPAETYQVPMADASLDAREIAFAREKEDIRPEFRGRIRNLTLSSAGMQVESYQLLLLPVWLAHYDLEGQSFAILVNGQTAEVIAETLQKHHLMGKTFS